MKRFVAVVAVIVLPLIFNGCSGTQSEYVPQATLLPPNIKSIAVKPFANETSETGIGNKLWLATTDEFIRDGRLPYVNDENKADGVVVGTIKQYRETELSHDEHLVPLEYQLWIVMNLKFLDRANNQYLWEEPLLEQKLRYFSETQPGGKTVEEARQELWDRFAQDIVRRTIDGFGSVTSSSRALYPKNKGRTTPARVSEHSSLLMAYLKPDQLEASLRSGKLGSLYLFDGPEAWLKDQAVHAIVDKLAPAESRDFNLEKFSGTNCSAPAVVTAVQSLPFLGERRIVILQQANDISAADQRIIADGLTDLSSTTCLILTVEGKANLREPLVAAAASHGNIVTFWPPFANQLPGWVVAQAKLRGKTLSLEAASMLADACVDLQQISNELEKLFLFVGEKKTIDGADVRQHGLPDQEGDTKELERMLWVRDVGGALQQGKLLSEMGVRGEMIFPVVERVFRSLMLAVFYKNERRMDVDDIAAELGFRSRSAVDQLKMGFKSYRPDELRAAFNKIAQADFEMKVGALPSAMAVSLLLLAVCGKSQPLANAAMRVAR